MRRALLIWCLLLAGIVCISQSERTSAFWQSRDSNYNISISTGGALACSYTPITSATYNVAYTGATPSASGGSPTYTFTQTGTLPTGFTISATTGVISGTDSVDSGGATYPGIQVKVTDLALNTVNCGSSFTITVAAGGYQGPGDIATFNQFFGFRSYSAAKAAANFKMFRLSRTDTHACDILAATNGYPGNASNCSSGGDDGIAVATWCASTTCTVTEMYDQSGALSCTGGTACDLTSANGSGGIVYTPNAINTYACGYDNGTSRIIQSSNAFTTAGGQPFSYEGIANRSTGQGSNLNVVLATTSGSTYGTSLLFEGTNTVTLYNVTGITATAADGSWHALLALYNGTSNKIDVDGTTATGGSGTPSYPTGSSVNMWSFGNANYMVGTICEAGTMAGDQSANFSALNTNMHAAYGSW
jgi:hypothetical protein